MTTTILLVGASRGLGLALATHWAQAGRDVLATVRSDSPALAATGVEVEHLDVTRPSEIAALRHRLAGRTFDLLFVNAGVSTDDSLEEVSDDEFARVMLTNALAPLRVVEALHDLVTPGGTVGVMSSGQGSVANNRGGGAEVYRGSKAALNTFVRSWSARHQDGRTVVLMAPGWIRTEMGGAGAAFTVEEAIPQVVATLDGLVGTPGLHYVDRFGATVPW